jgi:hypothetical protein
MLLPNPLVVARQSEIEAGEFLGAARKAAEHGDWQAIQRMIEDARKRFAAHPWVLGVLGHLSGLAKAMDTDRFRKEAMYSSQRFGARLASKVEARRAGSGVGSAELSPAEGGAGKGAENRPVGGRR